LGGIIIGRRPREVIAVSEKDKSGDESGSGSRKS